MDVIQFVFYGWVHLPKGQPYFLFCIMEHHDQHKEIGLIFMSVSISFAYDSSWCFCLWSSPNHTPIYYEIIKVIMKFEVKVNVKKTPLRFRGKLDNRCVGFIQFIISFIVAYGSNPQWLPCPFLLGFAFWILAFNKLGVLIG